MKDSLEMPVRTLSEIEAEIKIADREIAMWRSRGANDIAHEWTAFRQMMEELRDGRNLVRAWAVVRNDSSILNVYMDEEDAVAIAGETGFHVVPLAGEFRKQ